MVKWMIGLFIVTFIGMTTAVYAHVSGSFGDFLAGVKDERTTEKLKNEIEETKKEIEQITPRVENLKKAYDEKAGAAVSMINFYNTVGIDTYMNFILESGDVVDVLANQRLVEHKLESDLQQLNQLYLTYMPLKLAKESLDSYIQLLNMIEENLQAREAFFAENKALTEKELVSKVVMTWNENAGLVDDILLEDSDILNDEINRLVTRKSTDSPYRLQESLLNQGSNLTYYFRSDHIYVHYVKEDADVILIGQVFKTDDRWVTLKFEAGFLNGIQLSSELLKKLDGFKIDYQLLAPESKGFYLEQTNGTIIIQPKETAVE